MISNFILKNHLTFKNVNLEFDKGLIVFSGPSGSGKSVLFNSLLDSFGLINTEAERVETLVEYNLNLDNSNIDKDEANQYIFSKKRNSKNIYFLNNQLISKKKVNEISNTFIKHLHVHKNNIELENNNLINILNNIILQNDDNYSSLLNKYTNLFSLIKEKKKKLQIIKEKNSNQTELVEFTKFEIDKIKKLSPSVEEEIELFNIKKKLSNFDKIKEIINKVEGIFVFEDDIFKFLELINIEDNNFNEFFLNLRNYIELEIDKLNEIEDINIEEILDKIEGYSNLKHKYGSIEKALKYLENKEKELETLENLENLIIELENDIKKLEKEINLLLNNIHSIRLKYINIFEEDLIYFLNKLYINNINVNLNKLEVYNENGNSEIIIKYNESDLTKVSTGEFNRIRLGILALDSKYSINTGILFLDEIDANLSGEESMSVADVLLFLSKQYQIFAISHLPQLTSKAQQHFLVTKDKKNNISTVNEIKGDDREIEIARLISGKDIEEEALHFAKKLLKS